MGTSARRLLPGWIAVTLAAGLISLVLLAGRGGSAPVFVNAADGVGSGASTPATVDTQPTSTTTTSSSSTTTTVAPTNGHVTASTLPTRTRTTPDMYPKNGAVDANGKSLCPCNPVTGEPLGGSVVEKGFDAHVTDSGGHPLAGICVVFDPGMGSSERDLVTDASGRVSLDLGTSSAPITRVDISDCHPPAPHWVPQSAMLDGNGFTHVEAVLVPTASIQGTVLDQYGQPFAGLCVFAPDGATTNPPLFTADANGHYLITGVTPGTRSPYARFSCGPPPTAAILPFPGAGIAPTVTVAAGQTATLDFAVLRPEYPNPPNAS